MQKKVICILLVLLTSIIFSGCWNNRDITEIAIVTGCGVDITKEGKIEFTVQIISPKKGITQSGSDGSSGSNAGGSSLTMTSVGSTIFEAARNLIPILGKKAYYAQVQTVLIGEEAARQKGLNKVWDFFERDHEFSRTFSLLVVKNGTAQSVLEAPADVGQLGAVEIFDTASNTAFGKNAEIKAFKVSDILSQPLAGFVAGVINQDGASALKDMKIQGSAVFKDAKLVGYLDNEQTRGYVFTINRLKSTILTVPNPKEKGNLVSIEVISSNGVLSASIKDGKPRLSIQVQAQGNIGEEQGGADLTDSDGMNSLKTEAVQLIKNDIRNMMKKSQKEFDCDILNFSDYLHKHDNTNFKKIKSNWNKLYSDADVDIQVTFSLVRPGIITKPAYNP